MKKLLAVTYVLAAAFTAIAQSNASRSPAGEAPLHVRNGRAQLVAHFNPRQMLRLAFGLHPPHLAEEEQFLQDLTTPGSAQFHQFLTADQWNARFAPSEADEQAVVDWANRQGMTITHRFANRLLVDVEAPIATIEKAFGVRINNYRLDGYLYFSNEREPVIPDHLSGIVRSVGGLNNFPQMRPASYHGPIPPGPVYKPGPVVGIGHTYGADAAGPGNASVVQGRANAGQNDVPNITNGRYDPTDIYTSNAYNYDALKNQGHCCNPDHLPGGAPPESSIALATFGNLHVNGGVLTDIQGFHDQYPYLAVNVTTVPIDGGPGACTVTATQSCGNDGETALDAEWSTATSNSFGSFLDTAQVWVYEAGGSAEDMYNQMLSDGHALIFSTSWSCTEGSGCSNSEMDTRHGIFNQMIGQGWTLMTASGDRGATDDCATVGVSYPASDPDVIGVGGTLLGLFNDSTFNSEVAWTGGTSAKSCSGNNGGSGGGCSVHFDKPGFQTGANGSCGTKRSVPDIALNAQGGQNYYFNGQLSGVGGTSISSPMLAGFFAQEGAYLVYLAGVTGNNCGSPHQTCTKMGNGNAYLYQFGLNPTYAPHYPFYDITSGCNSNDITAASNLTSYCSGTGYDSVTGWGTANMLQLAWAINTFIAGGFQAPAVNFTGPAINHYFNTPQTVSWSILATSNNTAVPNGVAGFTQAWDTIQADSTTKATPGSGDSFYSGPQFPNASTGFLTLNGGTEGCHTAHVRAWDNGGSTGHSTYGPVCFDDIPPSVHCGSADGLWHGSDVSIHCTASDSHSGLANLADSSFNLTTSVPAGTDNNNAFTNSRVVADNATNTSTAGPIGGNMVDKKPPSVNCGVSDALWHASDVAIPCTASDSGSGLATPADANFSVTTAVAAGTETNNASTNSHAVLDKVGNSSTAGPIVGNMVDKKPPAITIIQPAATAYTHSSTLTLNYAVTDGGSGVATVTPSMNGSPTVGGIGLPSGRAISLLTNLALGPNTFAIGATDKVGNSSSASVTFTIIVTAQSMIDDISQLQASGAITQNTNSLLAKLNNALASRNRGQCGPSGNQYGAFINEVNAQTGKGITAAAAAILIADAQYLIAHCP